MYTFTNTYNIYLLTYLLIKVELVYKFNHINIILEFVS